MSKKLEQVNTHKVNKRKWNNWPDICQRVFNSTYETALLNQDIYLHPKATREEEVIWNTTCWNFAWMAADACQQALKDIIKMKGYAK